MTVDEWIASRNEPFDPPLNQDERNRVKNYLEGKSGPLVLRCTFDNNTSSGVLVTTHTDQER